MVCCSALQYVGVCCSVLRCVWLSVSPGKSYCDIMLQCVSVCGLESFMFCVVLQSVCVWLGISPVLCLVCNSVLQCVAACCSGMECVGLCCSVLQSVAVCCSLLQCVGVYCCVLQHGVVCMAWCLIWTVILLYYFAMCECVWLGISHVLCCGAMCECVARNQ